MHLLSGISITQLAWLVTINRNWTGFTNGGAPIGQSLWLRSFVYQQQPLVYCDGSNRIIIITLVSVCPRKDIDPGGMTVYLLCYLIIERAGICEWGALL